MREYSFNKRVRLLKSEEYLRLRKNSFKYVNKEFYLICKKNRLEYSRLGLTVSKKTGNAVKRNRIKRIIRDYYRRNKTLIKGNFDINIIAKQSAAGKTNKELFESLENVFHKIKNREAF